MAQPDASTTPALLRPSDVQPDEKDPQHECHRLELKSRLGEGAYCAVYKGTFDTRAEAVARGRRNQGAAPARRRERRHV